MTMQLTQTPLLLQRSFSAFFHDVFAFELEAAEDRVRR
jgi:hypothetical protein